MKRRANGTGTVYKMKGSRCRPWVARFPYGRDERQRRKWVTLGYYRTKSEAEKAIALNMLNPVSERHRITFAELFEEWKVGHYERVGIQAKRLYSGAYALLAAVHDKVFSEIRTAHYQLIFDQCTKSRSYQDAMKALLSMMYAYAIENDICRQNYAQFVKLGKSAKKPVVIFTDAEIKKLLDNDNLPGADITLMLIYSGFRIQELLNLTVFDVDLKNSIVTGGMKTESGTGRKVPIHPKTKKYWDKYVKNATDRLFIYNGKPMTQYALRDKIYYPLLEKLDIPKKTPHKCRDTCATLLARAGASTIAIQQIMGHTNYAFTANVYTGVNTDFLKENMCKIK